jgi:hypothetical protein
MTTPISTDALAPSITLIRTNITYTGPKLDKLKSNYRPWLRAADLFITLTGLSGYVDGTIQEPNDTEPRARAHWLANNSLAAALIISTVEASEQEYLDRKLGAKACWETIRKRHQSEGPIRQVQLLQEALMTRCTHTTPLPVTAEKICSSIDRAYEMGNISKDLLKCIALLGSLGNDFGNVRSIITRDISSSTDTAPFTSTQLRVYLDNKQNLINSDKVTPSESIALSAQQLSKSTSATCSNCKRNFHEAEYCIRPGGGMAGKTLDESKQACRLAHGQKSGLPTGAAPKSTTPTTTTHKVPIKLQGADGHIYVINMDSSKISSSDIPTANLAISPTLPQDVME